MLGLLGLNFFVRQTPQRQIFIELLFPLVWGLLYFSLSRSFRYLFFSMFEGASLKNLPCLRIQKAVSFGGVSDFMCHKQNARRKNSAEIIWQRPFKEVLQKKKDKIDQACIH